MVKSLLILNSLCLLVLLSSATKKSAISLDGTWKIETVIYEGDTLYQFGNRQYTVERYYELTKGWEKSKDDSDYLARCIAYTINGFQSQKITIENNLINKSILLPCWDHIKTPRIDNGTFTFNSNNVSVFDVDGRQILHLTYSSKNDQLVYSDGEWDYQIYYSRKYL